MLFIYQLNITCLVASVCNSAHTWLVQGKTCSNKPSRCTIFPNAILGKYNSFWLQLLKGAGSQLFSAVWFIPQLKLLCNCQRFTILSVWHYNKNIEWREAHQPFECINGRAIEYTGGWWHLNCGVRGHSIGWSLKIGMVLNTSNTWFPVFDPIPFTPFQSLLWARPALIEYHSMSYNTH